MSDPECTDWAAKVLIDMQAILESKKLEKALAQHLVQQISSESSKCYEGLNRFVEQHRKALVALLHFSAFQAATQLKSIVDHSKKDSIEAYLLLYVETKKNFDLPGSVTTDRMGYEEEAILEAGGEEALDKKLEAIAKVLQHASQDAAKKANYLSQLKPFFDVLIWDKIMTQLLQTSLQERRDTLMGKMDEVIDQLQNGAITQEVYDAHTQKLYQEYNLFEDERAGVSMRSPQTLELLDRIHP